LLQVQRPTRRLRKSEKITPRFRRISQRLVVRGQGGGELASSPLDPREVVPAVRQVRAVLKDRLVSLLGLGETAAEPQCIRKLDDAAQ
jgi:hypothetical protein